MNIVEPAFGNIPLALIRTSRTNPRKRFDEASLAELAKSIKQSGVGQPILVRPLPNTETDIDCVEIVAGERRFRASKLAGRETIPAIVRDMGDAEVLEFQLVENLQREDVHPIEEAEGYERLMKDHGLTADECAEKVGKSRSYIYGRLKFCALVEAARTAFYEGKLNASTALLIARIPVPALQVQATKEVISWNGSEPMSYRQAVRHVQSRYMLELQSAPFTISDITLVPAAGSCGGCPKRTGNQPELFNDVSTDVCTDPDCFSGKHRAQDQRTLITAKEKGIRILEVKHVHEAVQGGKNLIVDNAHMWAFDRVIDGTNKAIIDALTVEQRPEPTLYAKLPGGAVHAIYEKTAIQEALEKAGLCLTLAAHDAAMAEKLAARGADDRETVLSSTQKEAIAKENEIKAQAELESNINLTAYRAARQKAHDEGGMTIPMLRVLAKRILLDTRLPTDDLQDLYGFDTTSDETIAAYIDQADPVEVELLIMDMVIGSELTVQTWNIRGGYDAKDGHASLLELAEASHVDMDQIRIDLTPKPVEKETPVAAKKAPAVKKTKTATAKKTAAKAKEPAVVAAAKTPATTKVKVAKKAAAKKPDEKALDPLAAWPFPTGNA